MRFYAVYHNFAGRSIKKFGSVYIWLIRSSLTPDPSPAGCNGNKPQIFIAGEESSGERGIKG